MTQFNIDPAKGPEAAAGLEDEEFAQLLQILFWELALRTSREQFEQQIRQIAISRAEAEDDIETAKEARELQQFISAVMSDIQQLPEVGEARSEPTTGLYL